MTISHSPKQKEYLEFKKEIILQIPNIKVTVKYRNKKVQDKIYGTYDLFTTNSKFLNHIYKAMYKNGAKTVTRHQLDRLTPLGLALWYMDDGGARFRYRNNKTLISNRAVSIATNGFSYEEHKIIQKYFKENWGISVNIYRERESYYIWFQGKEAHKFLKIIAPYIIPLMKYKIDLRYKNPAWQYWLDGEENKPIIPQIAPSSHIG